MTRLALASVCFATSYAARVHTGGVQELVADEDVPVVPHHFKLAAAGVDHTEWTAAVSRNAELVLSESFLQAGRAGAQVNWPTAWKAHLEAEAKVVGEGAFGKVYLAKACKDKEVAIKKLMPQQGTSSAALTREAKEESKIQYAFEGSPYFMQFYSMTVVKPSTPYIMMEAAGGGTLEALSEDASNKKGTQATKMQLFYDLLKGIAEMHARNVVHRDLKPANVLLSQKCSTTGGRCSAKVADLGLSCVVTGMVADIPKCQLGSVAGTPLYIAPELYKTAKVDVKNDMWSLGMMLYELLHGSLPLKIASSRTLPQLQTNIKSFDITTDAKFTKLSKTSPQRKLLEGLLQQNLAKRSSAAEAVSMAASFNTQSAPVVSAKPTCLAKVPKWE